MTKIIVHSLLNINHKFQSIINPTTMKSGKSPRKIPINHSHTSSLSKIERKKFVFEQLSTNFDKIIGNHKKLPSLNLNLIQDIDLKMQKFKRTPSPEKKNNWNTGHSPIKPQESMQSARYIDLLRENFGIDDKDTLSLAKSSKNGLKKLQEKGFIDRHGTINSKFVSRYVEILGAQHPLQKSKTLTKFHSPKKPC